MIAIASPLSGWATPLDDVPDPVFAGRMLGDGLAIDPVEGVLSSPGDGRVVSVHAAGHAVTVELDAGPVILLHIGLDTVALGGEGFSPRVRAGDRVATGDVLIQFDLALLARKARSLITPMVITNSDAFRIVSPVQSGPVTSGKAILLLEPCATSGASTASDAGAEAFERTVRLPLAHGLHARPAARLAKLAAEYEAALEIVAEDGRHSSLRSAVGMLALSLAHGATVTLRGRGASAQAAVTAAADLLESGMGEWLEVADYPAAATAAEGPSELTRQMAGATAVTGVALGPAFRIAGKRTPSSVNGNGRDAEREALDAAISTVRASIAERAEGDGPLASIAAAHSALIDDPELASIAEQEIGAGRSAGYAWCSAIERFAAPLRASPDKRFAERVDDLADLEQAVLAALAGEHGLTERPAPGAILVGEDILPSHLMALSDAGLAGIASGTGGTTAHIAIIAAGLGIPMLCGLGPAVGQIESGRHLLIRDGLLTLDPTTEETDRALDAAARLAELQQTATLHRQEQAVTLDGHRIEVFANLASAADAEAAVSMGAEGCGLLRTEFLFLDRSTPPAFDEQREAYQAIADALGERPLIVRTLDIGADKPVPWLTQSGEENPALGLRGIRLQLVHQRLLDDQLRALVATEAKGGLRIMLPMVSDLAEIAAVRHALGRIAEETGKPAPELGIMVETPAAALLAPTLAAEADFFSIGSNDLAQYTLARDRTAASVAAGLDALHPAVLRLIAETVTAAKQHGRWSGICGGLAADPVAVPLLVGLGLDELSAPPAAVAVTKQIIRGLDRARCAELAQKALLLPDAEAVRALAGTMLEDMR